MSSDEEEVIVQGTYISAGRVRFNLSDGDERLRVTEIVGRLLQVPNFSMLLGAGASFHLGAPRIRAVSRDDVGALLAAAEIETSDGVCAILDSLVQEIVDLEQVLHRLTAALNYVHAFDTDTLKIDSRSHSVEDLTECYAALNLALAHACDLPAPDVDAGVLSPHSDLFRKVVSARRTDLPRVRLFTTNYDLAIERSLDHAGIHYLDGFRGGVARQLDLNAFSADLFARRSGNGGGSLVRIHELVHLYKIHGSLNWRRGPAGRGLMSSGIVQSTQRPSAENLAVIYPTPAKDSDVLGYPYSDLLRIFGTSLAEPESALVVCGYGFADDHINRLIEQALGHNPTMQLLVVDPVGVIDDGDNGEEVKFTRSVSGQLAQSQDNRIAVLTGPAAEFRNLHDLLPDVDPEPKAPPIDFAGVMNASTPDNA